VPFLGGVLALTTNIRLEWKGLAETNTLAYYIHLLIKAVKRIITLALASKSEKLVGEQKIHLGDKRSSLFDPPVETKITLTQVCIRRRSWSRSWRRCGRRPPRKATVETWCQSYKTYLLSNLHNCECFCRCHNVQHNDT
jgi:hypothetical protein